MMQVSQSPMFKIYRTEAIAAVKSKLKSINWQSNLIWLEFALNFELIPMFLC